MTESLSTTPSEERYRQIVEMIDEGVWTTDARGLTTYVNGRITEILGYPTEEIIGKPGLDFVYPDDVAQVRASVALRQEGIPDVYEVRLRHKEENFVWVQATSSPLRDTANNVVGRVAVISDISKRVADRAARIAAEESLRSSEERLRLAVAVAGLAIVRIDYRTDIAFLSPEAATLFGLPADSQVIPRLAIYERFSPEDQSELARQIRLSLNPSGNGWFAMEARITRPDGSERWIGLRKQVFFDSETRNPDHALLVAVDISESKRAERASQESHERFQIVARATNDAIWDWEVASDIVWWNDNLEALFGYDLPRGLTNPAWWLERVHPVDRERVEYLRTSVVNGGTQFWSDDYRFLCANGSYMDVYDRGYVLRDADGRPMRMIGAMMDITERKRSEQNILQMNMLLEHRVSERTAELEEAIKELEAFSYSVSHDLRAPLRAVDGFSRIVLEEYGAQLPDTAQDYLQDIRANARQMGALVDDLLAFSRLGRHPIKMQLVSMKDLVQDCLRVLYRDNEGRRVDVILHGIPPCHGDASLLKQVWLNLLSNAFKYSARRDPAIIEIGGNIGPERVTYFVRDNGVGFDSRYAHKLFGVFQRLHRAEDYEGTGVGLAIVHRIVLRHGGTVSADAQLDKGATFYFSIPDIGGGKDG